VSAVAPHILRVVISHPAQNIPTLIPHLVHILLLRRCVSGRIIIITESGSGCVKNAAIGVDLKGRKALYSIDNIIKGVYYE
jgi:hypothetical protein